MDAALLTRLRFEDDSAAGIAAALDRVTEERTATGVRIAEAHRRRAEVLLAGSAKDVAKVEAEARELEIVAEQLRVLEEELGPRARAARGAARATTFEQRAAEVRETNDTARAWLREEYPKLAQLIAHGLNHCRRAENSLAQLRADVANARRTDPDLDAALGAGPELPPVGPRVNVAAAGWVPPSQAVQLPGGPTDTAPIWWPSFLYGRPRPPGF